MRDKFIDIKIVENMAQLAYLELSQEDKGDFPRELASVLENIHFLMTVDVTGVEPTYQVLPLRFLSVSRKQDKATESLTEDERKIIFENAPDKRDYYDADDREKAEPTVYFTMPKLMQDHG